MKSSEHQNKTGTISVELNDVIVTWIDGEFAKAQLSNDKNKAYKIDGKKILDVDLIEDYNLVIFKIEGSIQFRYKDNRNISGSNDWVDYYFESISSSFYRKDSRGFWYDSEGIKLKSTVILKDDILISLNTKTSKKNQIFKVHKPYTSPNMELIQIGKIVLDKNLDPVTYFNEKITGLGKNAISFDNGSVYQEVYLGLDRTGFISEDQKLPIIINGNEIKSYKSEINLGSFTFHIFQDQTREYYVDIRNSESLDINNSSFILDSKSHLILGDEDMIKVKFKSESYYYNLSKNEEFTLSDLGEAKITKIEKSNVAFNNCELYNVSAKKNSIVIRSDDLTRYFPENKSVQIEKIKNVPGFENVFAFVTIQGKQQLFSLQSENLILLENDAIVAVDGHSKNKLLNAITANGQRIALDLRKGFKNLIIATTDNINITQTESEPFNVGSKILQNVKIQTLGGMQERVIDLNSEKLSIFKLPDNLMTYTDGEEKSVFAGAEIISINYEKITRIGKQTFLSADFRSYDDTLRTVMLDYKSGKPFRLDGLGHKLELVTSFIKPSKTKSYQIGPHTMIGARTLKEDLKTDALLFSTKIMSSWIPFSDAYLPILKRIVEINGSGTWEYNLYELRTLSSEKEFIAVEKTYPHRILAKNKGDKQEPIVVKSKEKVLKSPKEISMISKLFFTNTSDLADVY